MKKISQSIRLGANTYLTRQYKVVGVFFIIMFLVLGVMALFKLLTPFVPFAFVTGGFFSALSGFVGMKIATSSNARTANACRGSLNSGLRVAFSAGSVMGFTVVGLGMLDISIWFALLKYVFHLDAPAITSAMLTFGMGAFSMTLFARVGGGVFTKAADVGADLVGKVEAGIPEDDPRNPAVIADNVGDNVGDVAGMGADLYESYVGSVISASALGVAAFGGSISAMALPLLLASIGILCSILGTFLVRTKENATQKQQLRSLSLGTNFSALLIAVLALPLVGLILGCPGVVGMLGGATASGFLLAIFMSNSGGAWGNAKKYIESGVHGGKGSEPHKAAVVGDTVGDPFKDTAGPAINILIKLLSMVSIVFAALVLNFNLIGLF